MKPQLAIAITLFFLVSVTHVGYAYDNIKENAISLEQIKNFKQLSPSLASAGMPKEPEFSLIKQKGYQHIINLIPGDFSDEEKTVTDLSMSFEQVPVNWHEPKRSDFFQFVKLMKSYQQDKVLVHCQLNYRASAFVYLYQVTQLGIDKNLAQAQLHSIWQPEGVWLNFINDVEEHYKN